MKILVTGGAGFIGSAVVRHIITNTHDQVVNVDKLTYAGNLESLNDVSASERYVFEHADICDKAAMDRIFAEHNPQSFRCSLKPRPTRQAAHTLPPKRPATIWFAPGCAPTVSRQLSPIVQTTTVRIISRKS